jgi:hypothetical protein
MLIAGLQSIPYAPASPKLRAGSALVSVSSDGSDGADGDQLQRKVLKEAILGSSGLLCKFDLYLTFDD